VLAAGACVQTPVFFWGAMPDQKRKAVVFIDGSNLYKSMIEAGLRKGRIDFAAFSRKLVLDRNWVGTYFYTAPVHPQEKPKMAKRQQRFFSALRRTKGINLKLGVLVQRFETCDYCKSETRVMVEKGVDVLIAVDMIAKALGDAYDDAYLVSADADYVPAVEYVRYNCRKKVFCAAPKGTKYGNLANACNNAIPITQEFIDACQAY
jgi:uncharacterized LabA/DUF88 family protein